MVDKTSTVPPKMEVLNIIAAMHGYRKVNSLVDFHFGDIGSFIPKFLFFFSFFFWVLRRKSVGNTMAHSAARSPAMNGVERVVSDKCPSRIVILAEINLRDL